MVSKWKEKVVTNFSAHAHEYEDNNEIQEYTAQTMLRDMPNISNPQLLEIGCGTGTLTQHLLQRYDGGVFLVTDISEQMLNQAQQRFKHNSNIRWRAMDGEMPDIEQKFDIIVSNMAMQWFENISKGIENLKSFLNPGGTILYSIPAPTAFNEWKTTLERLSLPTGIPDYVLPEGLYKEVSKTIQYDSTLEFLKSLKRIGAQTPYDGYNALSVSDIRKACTQADKDFKGQMTWKIMFGKIEI